jgi:hypothetical protein
VPPHPAKSHRLYSELVLMSVSELGPTVDVDSAAIQDSHVRLCLTSLPARVCKRTIPTTTSEFRKKPHSTPSISCYKSVILKTLTHEQRMCNP